MLLASDSPPYEADVVVPSPNPKVTTSLHLQGGTVPLSLTQVLALHTSCAATNCRLSREQ